MPLVPYMNCQLMCVQWTLCCLSNKSRSRFRSWTLSMQSVSDFGECAFFPPFYPPSLRSVTSFSHYAVSHSPSRTGFKDADFFCLCVSEVTSLSSRRVCGCWGVSGWGGRWDVGEWKNDDTGCCAALMLDAVAEPLRFEKAIKTEFWVWHKTWEFKRAASPLILSLGRKTQDTCIHSCRNTLISASIFSVALWGNEGRTQVQADRDSLGIF